MAHGDNESLRASGFDENQAKGMAVALREAQTVQVEELVSKREWKELEGQVATKGDLAKVESQIQDLKRDMKEMELRMVIKTGSMILVGIGILFGLMRAWPLPVQYVQPQEMRYLPPATQAPATSPPAAMTGR